MNLQPRTILLVEDNPNDAALIQRVARKANLPNPIRPIADGQAAIEYLAGTGDYADRHRHPLPDLILLDLNLPHKSGFDVLAWLREQPTLRTLPVVMLTSPGDIPTIEQAFNLGANAYLIKPPTPETLRDLVIGLTAEFEPPRLLLIDDSPADRALALRELRGAFPNLQFTEIDSAEALAAALEAGGFDLVISDIAMPWAAGLGNLRAIKARWPACPVIILTGAGSEQIAAEAIRAGLDDYVLKTPQHIANLPLVVRLALGRTRQRMALRESESRYRDLVENSRDLICTHDLTGRILSVNPAVVKALGYSEAEILGIHLHDLLAPEWRAEFDIYLRAVREQGEASGLMQVQTAAGQRRIWEYNNTLRTIDVLEPIVRGMARDVTERVRAEAALRRSEAGLALAQKIAKLGNWELDLAAQTGTWSTGMFRLTGFDPTAGAPPLAAFFEWIHPEDRHLIAEVNAQAMETGSPGVVEFRSDPARGLGRNFVGHFEAIRDPQGRVVKLAGVLQDITERVQAEQTLHASEERFSKAFHASPVAISITTLAAGRFVEVNDSFLKLIGGSARGEVIGRPVLEVAPDLSPEYRADMAQALQEHGRVSNLEIQFITRAGDMREALASLELIELNGATCILTLAADITERRQHERELEAIVTMSAALRAARTRAEMLPVILDQLTTLLRAEGAAIEMLNPINGELLTELGRGIWATLTGVVIPPGEGLSAVVLASGQPYLNNDAPGDPRFFRPELLGKCNAVVGMPLRTQDTIIGLLWICRKSNLGQDDLRLLTAIADMTGNALQRATLHEQTERQVQRLAALHLIDAAISASLDLRIMLKVLLDNVVTQLGVDAAAVLLLKPHQQMLEYAAGRGFRSTAIERTRWRLREGQAGRAAREQKMIADFGNALPPAETAQILEIAQKGRKLQWTSEEFVAQVSVPLIGKGQTVGVLEVFHRAPLAPDAEWLDFLKTLAEQAALAIDNASLFEGLQRANAELSLAYDATIEGWSRALDLRDKVTEGHTQRVAELTLRLARAIGVSNEELVHLWRGALLHDIGKMGVPDGILLKPGPLTTDEWIVMKKHPTFAYEMLAPISYLRRALDIPYCHHEKWDGGGYPRGLKGKEIPLAARIFTVIDVWDALCSQRSYRAAWPEEKVRDYLREQVGKHFDPVVVEAFLVLRDSENL